MKVFVFLSIVALACAQESIDVHAGMNVGMHAGLALLLSFGILGMCTIGINIITRHCSGRISVPS